MQHTESQSCILNPTQLGYCRFTLVKAHTDPFLENPDRMMIHRAWQICPSPIKKSIKKSGDTEIFRATQSFSHKHIDFLQDTAKSAKNNTSDWKADWKIWVSWHCLIKLCCFSHQSCRQKVKHIASIQFSVQADTKWHSCLASSLLSVPSHLAWCWQGSAAQGMHQSCSSPGIRGVVLLSSSSLPRSQQSPGAPHGHALSTADSSLQRARACSKGSTCSCAVSLDPSAKAEQIPAGFPQQPPLPA